MLRALGFAFWLDSDDVGVKIEDDYDGNIYDDYDDLKTEESFSDDESLPDESLPDEEVDVVTSDDEAE